MFWQAEEAAVLRACQPTRGSVMLMVDPWEPDGRQHPLDNWSDPIALEKRESWNKKEKYVTGSPGWTGWSEIAVYAKTQLFECDTRMERSKDINLFIIYVCTEVPYSVVTEHFYLCTMVSREKWDSFYGKRGTRDENVSRGKKMWKECECEENPFSREENVSREIHPARNVNWLYVSRAIRYTVRNVTRSVVRQTSCVPR